MNDRELGMLDISEADSVEVLVRTDGRVIWVNLNGACCLRICQIKRLIVRDERDMEEEKR